MQFDYTPAKIVQLTSTFFEAKKKHFCGVHHFLKKVSQTLMSILMQSICLRSRVVSDICYLFFTKPIYGFASGDPLKFKRAIGHKDLFYLDDREVDFKEVNIYCYLGHNYEYLPCVDIAIG